jgi:predicted esterase
VAAPAYPFTSNGSTSFNAGDMANQPADASFVITEVLKLAAKAGDPLAGHIDPDRIGAGGHSAGAFTTAGMLSGRDRDPRLKAGIIVSGGSMGGAFSGAATPVLFIHGDSDAVVKYAKGRAAYDNLAWPKGFVTIIGGDHISPVTSSAALKTMVDFLRWTLYGDATARSRLASDATVAGKSRYESAW